jgi:hypothetical protein
MSNPAVASAHGEVYREISRAIRKAAPAAPPPISAVCRPLRIGLAPVKCPFYVAKERREQADASGACEQGDQPDRSNHIVPRALHEE